VSGGAKLTGPKGLGAFVVARSGVVQVHLDPAAAVLLADALVILSPDSEDRIVAACQIEQALRGAADLAGGQRADQAYRERSKGGA